MGCGSWDSKRYEVYTSTTRGVSCCEDGSYKASSLQDAFKASEMSDKLNPFNVIRECCDCSEHPNTIPVILAFDVTGSMGSGARAVSEQLNPIMTKLYEELEDVQIMVIAIGDLCYDRAPLQVSQFESDIRIAEQLDLVWFEGGGGSNKWESYTAAWYFGLNHTKLDCWNRNQKGIIITMGDEQINPCLYKDDISKFIGDSNQSDIDTSELFKAASNKFNIFHISIDDRRTNYDTKDSWSEYRNDVDNSWVAAIGKQNYFVSTIDNLRDTIINIVKDNANIGKNISFVNRTSDGISW